MFRLIRPYCSKIPSRYVFTKIQYSKLSSSVGLTSMEANNIAQSVFKRNIRSRDFLLKYFVKVYLEKHTKLPINIIITNYYLRVPSNVWLKFLYSDEYIGSIIHVDNEEVYDKIRQHNLKEFLLEYIESKCDKFVSIPNLSIVSDIKHVNNDVLWNGDNKHKIEFVKNKLISEKNMFNIGFTNKCTI